MGKSRIGICSCYIEKRVKGGAPACRKDQWKTLWQYRSNFRFENITEIGSSKPSGYTQCVYFDDLMRTRKSWVLVQLRKSLKCLKVLTWNENLQVIYECVSK